MSPLPAILLACISLLLPAGRNAHALILSATSDSWETTAKGLYAADTPYIIDAPKFATDNAQGIGGTHQLGFDEQQGVFLEQALEVDSAFRFSSPLTAGGAYLQGVTVDSHMLFLYTHDLNPESNSGYIMETVSWTFSGKILGVMSDMYGLLAAASHDLLGADGTTYFGSDTSHPGGGPGIEPQYGRDLYTVSGNTLTLTLAVNQPGDWVRVITESPPAPVPEPSAILLLASGLAGLAACHRKKA